MNAISAFVAHSFDEDDSELIRTFLDYLSVVTKLHPNFRWAHAENAEPKHVAEKVLALLTDANLLIAICTKKELVVSPKSLSTSRFYKSRSYVTNSDLSWKTSDWIIQEIGLAVGRKMQVILLVERGVKTPGELQGSLEYIEFDRTAPEKSFEKLLQMLISISGAAPSKSTDAEGESVVAISASADSNSAKVDRNSLDKSQDKWDFEDFRFALFRAIAKEKGEIEEVDQQFVNSEFSQIGENRAIWEASKEFFQILLDGTGDLRKLINVYEKNKDNSIICGYLANSYDKLQEYDKAAKQFEITAKIEAGKEGEISWLGEAALAYKKDDNAEQALAAMQKLRGLSSGNSSFEKTYLIAEREYAKAMDDSYMQIATMERLLELDPMDNNLRFSLAFKYSNIENFGLAAWHYQRIPVDLRSSATWNNLGVAYANLNLHGLAVENYRRSEKEGETLAMSNLAYKLIEAGFFDEAKTILDDASKIDDYNKNIDSAKVHLSEEVEKEERIKKEKFEEVKKESDFLRHFGRALSLAQRRDISGEWIGPSCTLTIVVTGDQFLARGTYLEPVSALYKGLGLSAEPTPMEIQYSGRMYHGAIICAVIRKTVKASGNVANSLFGTSESATPVLMAIQDGFDEIRVIERKESETPDFYALRRTSRLVG